MKLRVLFIALLLLAPLTPSISATPPKAGAICSKAGITKNYNGKKFTCIKKGKKVVWNKGVLIKKSATSPSPIPTPIPTPTPTPTSAPSTKPTSQPSEVLQISSLKPESNAKNGSIFPGETITDQLIVSSNLPIESMRAIVVDDASKTFIVGSTKLLERNSMNDKWQVQFKIPKNQILGSYIRKYYAITKEEREYNIFSLPLVVSFDNTQPKFDLGVVPSSNVTNGKIMAGQEVTDWLLLSSKIGVVDVLPVMINAMNQVSLIGTSYRIEGDTNYSKWEVKFKLPVDLNLGFYTRKYIAFNSEGLAQNSFNSTIEIVPKARYQHIYDVTLQFLKENRSQQPIKILTVVSPNVKLEMVDSDILTRTTLLQFYQPFFGQYNEFTHVYFTEKDTDWYLDTVELLEGSPRRKEAEINGLLNFKSNREGHPGCSKNSICGGANSSPLNGNPVSYTGWGTEWNDNQPYVIDHEVVHDWQLSLFSDGMYRMPPWMIEGLANFLQNVTASTYMDINDFRKSMIADLEKTYPRFSEMTISDWKREIFIIESDHEYTFRNYLGYSIGMLLTEYLSFSYGFRNVIALMNYFTNHVGVDLAYREIFRVDLDFLHFEMGKYIYEEIQALKS